MSPFKALTHKTRGIVGSMKKLTATILSIIILLFFTSNTFAQTLSLNKASNSTRGSISNIKHTAGSGREEIAIYIDKYSGYNVLRLSNPERIVVDLSDVEAQGRQKKIDIGSKLIKGVRYAQFDEGIARVVLDVNERLEYEIVKKPGILLVYIYEPDGKKAGNNSKGSTDEDNSDARDGSSGLADRSGSRRQSFPVNNNFLIEYAGLGNNDEVSIFLDNYKNYKIMRLTGPDRIVIDIPDARIDTRQQKIDINSGLIKSIRYAQFQKNTARVVLDVVGQSMYHVIEDKGRLVLNIESPAYKNLVYHSSGDRVYFTLEGVKLTEGGEKLKKFYTGKYDSTGKKYTITFSSDLAKLDSGTLNINDGLLESVQITNDEKNNTTSITFNAKDKFVYEVFTRPQVNNTAITILKPASKSEKLVVIDAGHGGVEPGAVYGNIYEKDLNLDIALRLKRLLEKKNVKTYMIREDDSFVGLYERAYIANSLNASLFLSIHNNAMGDPGFGGTMTLCYPYRSNNKGLSGKAFAQIVQDNLLKKLGTKDRKVIERPNLVVLKATTMPAALAEVAFMTNSEDRSNLQNSSFRDIAAQALCDSIIEALSHIK
jgi:N-acetylmuramoyl-L-alanine amidase